MCKDPRGVANTHDVLLLFQMNVATKFLTLLPAGLRSHLTKDVSYVAQTVIFQVVVSNFPLEAIRSVTHGSWKVTVSTTMPLSSPTPCVVLCYCGRMQNLSTCSLAEGEYAELIMGLLVRFEVHCLSRCSVLFWFRALEPGHAAANDIGTSDTAC